MPGTPYCITIVAYQPRPHADLLHHVYLRKRMRRNYGADMDDQEIYADEIRIDQALDVNDWPTYPTYVLGLLVEL